MWHTYVTNVCTKTWGLPETATGDVVRRIQALAAVGEATDEAIEAVLMEAGIDTWQAVRVAPTIRVAISA